MTVCRASSLRSAQGVLRAVSILHINPSSGYLPLIKSPLVWDFKSWPCRSPLGFFPYGTAGLVANCWQTVLGDGAFCHSCYGRTVHGYSLELVRLQDAYYCDALDLTQVILPGCHRAVIWFPVSLGWGCVGTVCFFSRIWYKLLEGLHLTITVPLTLMQDDRNHTRSITAWPKKARKRDHYFGETAVS